MPIFAIIRSKCVLQKDIYGGQKNYARAYNLAKPVQIIVSNQKLMCLFAFFYLYLHATDSSSLSFPKTLMYLYEHFFKKAMAQIDFNYLFPTHSELIFVSTAKQDFDGILDTLGRLVRYT